MLLTKYSPKQSLNKANLKEKISRSTMDQIKQKVALISLVDSVLDAKTSIDQDSTAKEKEIDQLVYQLYDKSHFFSSSFSKIEDKLSYTFLINHKQSFISLVTF